jgi:hypothetical protein
MSWESLLISNSACDQNIRPFSGAERVVIVRVVDREQASEVRWLRELRELHAADHSRAAALVHVRRQLHHPLPQASFSVAHSPLDGHAPPLQLLFRALLNSLPCIHSCASKPVSIFGPVTRAVRPSSLFSLLPLLQWLPPPARVAVDEQRNIETMARRRIPVGGG